MAHPSSDLPSDTQRPSGAIAGALYAEKAHAMLVNRFGPRQSRPVWLRNERGQMVTAQDSLGDTGGVTSNVTRQELIDLLQSHILLSIFYAGNAELDLAVEIHASAVKIAQRMGVNMMDDPIKLQDFSGIFSSAVAQNQRKRAQNWSSSADPNFISGSGPSTSGSRSQWQSMSHQPPPLPGGPNDVEMHEPDGSSYDPTRQTGSSNTADLRQSWIEFETLRRLWWSMFVLDRMYHMTAGSLRMIHIGSFRVRLPCSDLEWDSMHAQPTTVSPNTASANATGNQMQGLMVRTFGEAVMHTSLSEQAGNEIPATPGLDPDVYRYSAALAGLIDSVIDFGEDIRALVTPPLMEGTEILAQLRAEQRSSGGAGDYEHASARSAYGRYGMAARGEGSHPASRQYATAVWLGSRKSGSEYIQGNRSGWHSSSVGAAWPPDWRSRMRVLQERVSALEARFTEWYSSMPIAQYARKPYLYSQLPLQDRITYFHQQIVYYGGVIQLQSLIVMTQGLLLPDTVEEGHVSFGNGDGGIGLGTLTNMMWRSLMDMDPTSGPGQSAGHGDPRAQGHALEGSGEPVYGSRRRQFGVNSGWGPRRQYGSIGGGDDDAHYVPLDEDGNSPEIIREELQRMLQAAWRRCTEAATAMSAAVKRATAGRRVASSNPHTAYYDPTFRPQVLPPYRGDVVSGDSSSSKFGSARGALSSMTPAATAPGSMSHYERAPATGDMRESPQQPHSSGTMSHGSGDRPLYPPIDRRGSGPPAHAPYSQQMQPPYAATLPPVHNPNALADAAAGPGQVVDDATFFMRFNLFTCTAAYVGAYIHLQNLRLIPRWELSIQRHSEAVAKNNEMRSMHAAGSSSMAGVGLGDERGIGLLPDPQDIGALPPQLPPSLPPLPCTQEQAREAVRPLVRILEGISPYWRVSAQVAKLREMWRDVDGTELDSNPSPTVPSQRQWSGHQMQPPVPSYSHHLHPHPHQQHHHHGQPRLAHPPIPSPRPPSSHHNAGMPIPSLVDASQPQSQSQSQPQSQLPPPQQQQQYPHHRLSGGMPPPRP
ncbi:hypothetical protein LPJ53_000438 [Coemansia erecta]|uniref:Xylanolytic transcriptional activator regulatory domain-containing protein n=1 Tax=Coemansia erecta TaxID=147472 RepID=A0A9W7Y8L0_9FUNG|nr:hypothetical protein LPJ53_000438 [Coemansia erecta]